MCTEEDHEIKARLLFRGLLYGAHYNGGFKCGECGEIILSIRDVKLHNNPLNANRAKSAPVREVRK